MSGRHRATIADARQVYTRAQRSDFDSWKTPGWAADDMLPFLKKVGYSLFPPSGRRADILQMETYHGKGDKDPHRMWFNHLS